MHEIEKQRLQDIADFVGLSQGRSLAYLIERYYRTHEKQIVAFRAVMAQAQEHAATARLEMDQEVAAMHDHADKADAEMVEQYGSEEAVRDCFA